MSSRAYSLQEYCDNLRCIKAKNVPTIAARLARTIMSLPTNFNSRKIELNGTAIDRSGQYFDTVWNETIGSTVASIQGLTLTDAKYVLDRLEDLSRSVIKFGLYYSGRISATTPEFTSDLNLISVDGEFYRRVYDINSGVGSTQGLTYNELGYYVDQATLNDPSAERDYDLYEFLRDVSEKDIFTWVYVIQNFITCTKVSNQTRFNALRVYSEKLLDLTTNVVRIILDIEHKFDDIRPVNPVEVKNSRDTITTETLTTFDPESDGWNFPDGCQPTSWSNAFYIPRYGNYRLAIKVQYPYTIKEFRIKEKPVELITIQNESVESGTGATYVTETLTLNKGDVVSYLIETIPGVESEFDPSKIKVYMFDVSDGSDLGYTEPISNYPWQPDEMSLEIYPIITDEVSTAVVDSSAELVSASYNEANLFISTEQSDRYDSNYPYHYLIKRTAAYEDTSIPITLKFAGVVNPKSVNVSWYTPSQDEINRTPVDGLSQIESQYFPEQEGWINITDSIQSIVDNMIENSGADTSFTTISKHISIGALSEINGSAVEDDGTYQYGMLFTRPLGAYAIPDQAYIGVGGSVTSDIDGTNIFTEEDTTVEMPSSSVVVTKTKTIEEESVYDFLVNISLKGSSSVSISSLSMAILRGTKVYVRRASGLSYYMRVVPYRTIQSVDGSMTELPPKLELQVANTNKFLSLDGNEIEFANKYSVSVKAGQILAFTRRLIRKNYSTVYSEPTFHIVKRVLDVAPYYKEIRRVVITPRVEYSDVVNAPINGNYASKAPDVDVIETTGADVLGGRLTYGVSNSKDVSEEVGQVCTEYLSFDEDDYIVIISVDRDTAEYGTGANNATSGYMCTHILPHPIYNRRMETKRLFTYYYKQANNVCGFGYWAYRLPKPGLYWIEFINLAARFADSAADAKRCPQIYYTTDPNAANESAGQTLGNNKFGEFAGWNVVIYARSIGSLTFNGITYKLLDHTSYVSLVATNSTNSWRLAYDRSYSIKPPYVFSKLFNLTKDRDGNPITGLMMLTPAYGNTSGNQYGTGGFTYKIARISD